MKKKELIGKILLSTGTIILSMILLPLSVVSAKVIPNDKTGIPDKNLYQAILFELDKKSDKKITDDDLEEVYSIGEYFIEKNRNKKVKNLKGLEKFKKLYSLEIPIKGSTSLKGIDKIPNLQQLTIRNSKLKNLNVLKKVSKLERLTMQNIKVKDWTALGQLKGLTSLEIDKCNLRSFRQIKKLTKLDSLIIKRTKLKKLKGIEKLTQLWDLDVSYNKLTKLPSLKKLKKLVLEHTSFSGNKISEKELKKKLPSKVPNKWLNNQVFYQNTKKKLKVNHVENINVNTTKITGVTEKQIKNVVLMTEEGEKIKTVKSNKKGKFSFEELDLSAYKGKKLKIVILRIFYDSIKDESGFDTLRTVKFMVQNK